jgi:hypothetical protein
MKKTSMLLIAVALSVAAASGARVSGNALKAVEGSIDQRFKALWEDNPFTLIRPTRGIYLEGYGAVFTVDVSPVLSSISLMHPVVSKEEVLKAHKARLERVPQVKQVIRLAMADAAASLDPLPADDLITFVVFLDAHQWEDVSGTPAQLTFRAKKNALLEARRGGAAALTPVVQITEN